MRLPPSRKEIKLLGVFIVVTCILYSEIIILSAVVVGRRCFKKVFSLYWLCPVAMWCSLAFKGVCYI